MGRAVVPAFLLVLSAGCGASAPAEDRSASGATAGPTLAGVRSDGREFSLGQLSGSSAVILFVRGSFCPLCLERLRVLSAYTDAYGDAGARVIAVTLDPPRVAHATAERLGLRFPLVSADAASFRRWGIWPPEQAMPSPGDFVLDAGGRIRYRRIGSGAADHASDVALLATLDSLRSAGTSPLVDARQ